MPKATYSDQLLTDISNGTWREPALSLSEQKLDAVAVQKLANALAQNKLTSLDLNFNNIGAEGAKALAQNTTLTSLNLSVNDIGAEGAKALAHNKMLTSLNLVNNNIGDEGVKALAHNKILTSLSLVNNNIGDEGAKALAHNTTLTSLDLDDNNIGDEGAKALAHNTMLTSLDLGSNNIGAEGAKALAHNTTLTSLYLYCNDVGAEGAKALAQNTTLTSLNLDVNNIGAEGAKALAHNTTLTSLNLALNNIGAEEKTISEMLMRNKKLRQVSLTTAINHIISVPDLISIILKYSNDYTSPEARQHTGKAAKGDKQADEESTHSLATVMNAATSNPSAAANVFFSGGGSSVNASNANSHAQTADSAPHEGVRFFKAKHGTKVNDSQAVNNQPVTATMTLIKK